MPDRNPTDVPSIFFVPEEPITWVGAGPGGNGFCFASDSGTLWLTDYGLRSPGPLMVFKSGEPVNGVAFTKDLMVASTRDEVVIFKLGSDGDFEKREYIYQGGAHEVISSAEGRVIAPLGNAGLLLIQPQGEGRHARTVIRAVGGEPYFYRTIQLGKASSGGEFFASAGRTDGVIMTPIGPEDNPGTIRILKPSSSHPLHRLDVVDICSLNEPSRPRAIAFLGMDCSIHLSANIGDDPVVTMIFDKMKGTPYSIHSAKGHLFILTSERLYVLQGLVDRFFDGSRIDSGVRTKSMEVDAVDCAIVNEEYLLVIQEEGVSISAVKDLFGSPAEARSSHQRIDESAETMSPKVTDSMWDSALGYDSEIRPEIMEFV